MLCAEQASDHNRVIVVRICLFSGKIAGRVFSFWNEQGALYDVLVSHYVKLYLVASFAD